VQKGANQSAGFGALEPSREADTEESKAALFFRFRISTDTPSVFSGQVFVLMLLASIPTPAEDGGA